MKILVERKSLQHLLSFLTELNASSADLYLHKQGVDTTTPAGKALFQMMGVFGSMITDRVRSGIERER